jgi:uncharacterized protein
MMLAALILNLPGIGNSGPKHWQTLWEASDRRIRRVLQKDWDNPVAGDWIAELEKTVAAAGRPPVLIAHSLGCLLAVHWAVLHPGRAAGALLVAPVDPESIYFPPTAQGFVPVPMKPLGLPSIVVESENDPFAEPGFAARAARAWGARIVNAGKLGHINADSAIGAWPFGRALLEELLNGKVG